MITHKILMKHFGSKLKSNFKRYQKKILNLPTSTSDEEFATDIAENRGINIRSLVGIRFIRAAFREGIDGESYIDILNYNGYKAKHLLTLASFESTTLYFNRANPYTRDTNRLVTIYNLFLPPEYLLERKDNSYMLGTKYLLSRFKETSIIRFNSSLDLEYGLNIMPLHKIPATKRQYTVVKNTVADNYIAKLKLLGHTNTKILIKKARALREDIEPKYMQLLGHIMKGQPETKDIINFLVITGNKTPEFPFNKAATQFKHAIDKDKLYAQALLEAK